jgi:hypothetical protein
VAWFTVKNRFSTLGLRKLFKIAQLTPSRSSAVLCDTQLKKNGAAFIAAPSLERTTPATSGAA